jgi:HTH-type transcriptional regulator/antitoxin HipB
VVFGTLRAMTRDAREDPFDTGGHVARARRVADLSQRELADAVGVNQTTVARWEAGTRSMTVDVLDRVLRLAGLRLAVVDEDGQVVRPMDPDVVRDNAGRRFPAHLDVVPPDQRPSNRGAGQRYDRSEPRAWYALRSTRDRQGTAGTPRPADHPTVEQLTERRTARRRTTRRTTAQVSEPLPECTCPDRCFEQPACPQTCACRCETPWTGL